MLSRLIGMNLQHPGLTIKKRSAALLVEIVESLPAEASFYVLLPKKLLGLPKAHFVQMYCELYESMLALLMSLARFITVS